MTVRIVVIDGQTLNPGDLSWDPLRELGEVTLYDRTEPRDVMERLSDAAAVFTNKVPFDAGRLAALPALRYIGVTATGYNIIDTAAAGARGVTVTNVPTYGTDTVAQHTIALMLELARNTAAHAQAVAQGGWNEASGWCLPVGPVVELSGKTLGMVGFGRIGLATARIAQAMGMRVIAFTPSRTPIDPSSGVSVSYAGLDTVFAEADVLSLHCPLTPETHHVVNAERLGTMKRSAFVVNTSRGALIDSHALAAALRAGAIAGAAVDVLEHEPPAMDEPLLAAPRCVITGHVAWYAREARQRLMDQAVENLRGYLAGRAVNVVSSPG